MKRFMLAAAMICALGAAPASAQTYRTYRCSNSTALRVIFDEERGTATVVPFGRPSIRLDRVAGGPNFHYARRNTHELRGNAREVLWRSGSASWTCRRSGN
ncbi:MAG: hypothetical protein R3C27_13755 [Hyphomonadaceae bacterium]